MRHPLKKKERIIQNEVHIYVLLYMSPNYIKFKNTGYKTIFYIQKDIHIYNIKYINNFLEEYAQKTVDIGYLKRKGERTEAAKETLQRL